MNLNNNRVLGAVTMLTMNICGKYFANEFPDTLDILAIKNIYFRFFHFILILLYCHKRYIIFYSICDNNYNID